MKNHKLGLILGSFAALVHFLWSILIALGWAQSLLDFIYKMHSLNNPFTVMSFNFSRAVGLIVLTFVIGYIVGNVLSVLWKKFSKADY